MGNHSLKFIFTINWLSNLALCARVEWLARYHKGEQEIWVVHTINLIDLFSSDIILSFFKDS